MTENNHGNKVTIVGAVDEPVDLEVAMYLGGASDRPNQRLK